MTVVYGVNTSIRKNNVSLTKYPVVFITCIYWNVLFFHSSTSSFNIARLRKTQSSSGMLDVSFDTAELVTVNSYDS